MHELHNEDDNKNASQHTFYISNAQRRLKLQAKNAVSPPQVNSRLSRDTPPVSGN